MGFRVNFNKLLLASIGTLFPCRRHPFGKLGNALRVHFARQICAKVGKGCLIEKGASFNEGAILDDYSAVGVNCFIDSSVHIKGHNMMGPNVKIYTRNHFYDDVKHCFDGNTAQKKVIVGAYTWIGTQVLIMPGASIGDHSIIGAGAVVSKTIPSGVLAAGNPCVVKKIIDKEFYKG
jgi:maltose O-acetyltransferase